MVRAVVYGYSTEGYALASQLAENGAEVHLVDESTASAVRLSPEIAKTYPNVSTFMDDEPLLDAKPIKMAVKDAKYLFFAPRIRKAGAEAKTETSLKFKDATAHLSDEGSVVYCAPVGLGGNSEYMELLKHVTGIDAAQTASYHYYPLDGSGRPDAIGSVDGREDSELSGLLGGGEFVEMEAAERMHAVRVLSRFSKVASAIEIYKNAKSPMPSGDEVFLDSMIDGLFDLQLMKDSRQGTKPGLYLINGSIRGIEGYVRRLADSVRTVIRENGLKVSRTSIVLAWNLDKHGMRSDKINAFKNLNDRLRNHTGTVLDYAGMQGFYSDKTMVVVACSRADYNVVRQDPDIDNMVVIKAVPAIPE